MSVDGMYSPVVSGSSLKATEEKLWQGLLLVTLDANNEMKLNEKASCVADFKFSLSTKQDTARHLERT